MNEKHLMSLYALAMLAYTGWRTYDYMRSNLADTDAIVGIVVAASFLMFSELGLIVWLHYAMPHATTSIQETVSTALVWLNFWGIMIVNLADLAKHNHFYVIDLSQIDAILFITPWVMVVMNVGGYLLYFTHDAEEQVKRAERKLKHAENMLHIESRLGAVQDLRNQQESMRAKLTPLYTQDIKNRVINETHERFGLPVPSQPQGDQAQPPTLHRSQDAQVVYDPDTPAPLNGKSNQTDERNFS